MLDAKDLKLDVNADAQDHQIDCSFSILRYCIIQSRRVNNPSLGSKPLNSTMTLVARIQLC